MKISEQEKAQTRIRLLEAAVDVITEKGFKSASMREIAQRAKVGDATIYNYFPSKEKLLYGYCEEVQHRVMAALKGVENFHEYAIGEQLQQLVTVRRAVADGEQRHLPSMGQLMRSRSGKRAQRE